MTIDAKTELYGIFGNPVSHSLSPVIHNAVFKRFGVNAVYLAFEIPVESLGLAFEAIRALGLGGVNLTIPFKEPAINFIDEIPEDVDRCIGALNTVVNQNGKLMGFNTDGPGFLASLGGDLGVNPEGKTALVLGAGGGARGVAFALARAHADKIWIHNRTAGRAEGLAEYLSTFFPDTDVEPLDSFETLRGRKADLVVNATPCGMRPADPSPFDLRLLKQAAHVYDLVYNQTETALLKQARQLGIPCVNGIGMLAAQAALSFELWTGRREGVREALLEALRQCPL